eukprot:1149481-Pyramimonas_sp.AAC.1
MLDAIRRDLCSRAGNDFPRDPAERTRMSSQVAAIRRSRWRELRPGGARAAVLGRGGRGGPCAAQARQANRAH